MHAVFEIECPRETGRDREPVTSGLDSGVQQPDEGLMEGHFPTAANMAKFNDRVTVSKIDRDHGKCNPPTPLQLAQCSSTSSLSIQADISWGSELSEHRDLAAVHHHLAHALVRRYQQTHHQLHLYHDHGHPKPEQPHFPRSRENPCDKSRHLQRIHMLTYTTLPSQLEQLALSSARLGEEMIERRHVPDRLSMLDPDVPV